MRVRSVADVLRDHTVPSAGFEPATPALGGRPTEETASSPGKTLHRPCTCIVPMRTR
jgi:hypothetical protein